MQAVHHKFNFIFYAALQAWIFWTCTEASASALRRGHQHRTKSLALNPQTRALWTYWDDTSPPDFVRLCIQSFQHHAGNVWDLQVVSRKSARDYVSSSDLPERFDDLQPSFQADALRLALLRRHGGAWIDATTIANQDFSSWINADFAQGSRFVGFFIRKYSKPDGPPLVASWALAVPAEEDKLMIAWHEAYLRLWKNRTSDEDISDDPFFNGVDLSYVDPLMQDYLNVELVLLAVLQRNPALLEDFNAAASLLCAEDTAYTLQSSMGMSWMINNKCAPITTPFSSLPIDAKNAVQMSPLIKLRHQDRKWLMAMPESLLLSHSDSVIGSLLAHNVDTVNMTHRSDFDAAWQTDSECED